MYAALKEDEETSALAQADMARIMISAKLDADIRSKLGQFMTPAPVATFMAKRFTTLPKVVRLLDAGAGVGTLTAAFVNEACLLRTPPEEINVTAFEVDKTLSDLLEMTLMACEAQCQVSGIDFKYEIIRDDYILHSAEPLISQPSEGLKYNCAILNPPYAKINSKSNTRSALRRIGIETSNLYTAFVAFALLQLEQKGQMVAITPRSFCNGSYFEPFRHFMLECSALESVHLYESRRRAFSDDDVLQENIIFKLVKSEPQPVTVRITSNSCPQDINMIVRDVPYGEVVHHDDSHSYIHLTVTEAGRDLAHKIITLPCSLRDLGINVSTGRVVDFRAKEHLRLNPDSDAVPLIYPCHFEQGYVSWPKKGGRKPNALASNASTSDLMVPRGIYVLTKRFTSKEEKRRLVAVIFDPESVPGELIGFENHLNYFHENGHGLTPDLALGLCLFLNSSAVDGYFRQFSGHTQVNATDLRNLRYPDRAQLERIGRGCGRVPTTQEAVDSIIETLLAEMKPQKSV